ncbi:MAG: DNA replication/repair protein RecF [Armatimonadetes bacterium]|nr:DNA replication/repair protein RecF [Armatimonadota bacterium]
MRVSRLELFDFRNYETCRIEPGAGLNVLVGANAQGKTNLLEAVGVLATTKSVRAGRDTEMVRFGAEACRIVAEVVKETGSGDTLLEIAIGAGGAQSTAVSASTARVSERKLVKINHGKQTRIADLIGHLNAVFFSSLDLDIVRGEPTERRRFLDYEIAQVSPAYLLAYAQFKKALEQRNRLLKDIRFGAMSPDALDAWTEQIIRHGARLMERRRAYIAQLAHHADTVQRGITDGAETLTVEYCPSFALDTGAVGEAEIAEAFRVALAGMRREELARGSTLLGPQRDDLQFRVGTDAASATDVRLYGSQGQQRTVALALRLAERRLLEEMVGEPPVVLLDDVLSDLDERRRKEVLALSLTGGQQTFLTVTETDALPPEARDAATIWEVNAGVITRRGG